jgi:hypothetical protein
MSRNRVAREKVRIPLERLEARDVPNFIGPSKYTFTGNGQQPWAGSWPGGITLQCGHGGVTVGNEHLPDVRKT